MSNVVYKGKGQVPLYRIYRHSITPQGPQEGQGQHFPWEQCLPDRWFSTAGWAARHPQPASLQPLFLLSPIPPYPQLLMRSPMS